MTVSKKHHSYEYLLYRYYYYFASEYMRPSRSSCLSTAVLLQHYLQQQI